MPADNRTRALRNVERDPSPLPLREQQLEGMAGEGKSHAKRLTGGGTDGNERLTAATGIVLVLLLAVIGITLLRMHSLISVHLFVGLLLIPPIALKLSSTGYRFVRYYTSDAAYRKRGAPPIVLRLSAPMVVAC